MITLKDIRIAIVNQLKTLGIPVKAQDIEKGFARPSFSVFFDEVKIETLYSQIETSLIVRIYYFTKIEGAEASIEILEMQQELPILFGNNLIVKDRAIHISDIDSSEVDGVFMFEFNMLFEQAIETNEVILTMENLNINIDESE